MAAVAVACPLSAGFAADLAAPKVVAPAPPPAFTLFEGVEFHAQAEGGILGNVGNPQDSQNVGQLYTDRANTPLINQVLFSVSKAVDPKATGYAFGFTAQGIFGSDERYNHFLGLGDSFITSRNQLGVLQAYVAGHLPWFTDGGVDVKVGLFTSPQGYETLDPSTSPFYSHSYIYNYAVTFNHTGIITTTHVNSTVDFYLGVDTGNQTTFGTNGDPNRQPAGFVGVGFNNLLNDKLTILALSHIGPENNFTTDPQADRDLRYYNAIDFTYKLSDSLTSVTELDYVRDDFRNAGAAGIGASGYGISQYLSYAFNSQVSVGLRGEVFRDADGFFVANFPGNLDLVRAEKGFPNTAFTAGPTTYSEVTLGLTYKPDAPKPFLLVAVRPEIRYDRSLSGNSPYLPSNTNVGRSKDQFTFGGDLILGF